MSMAKLEKPATLADVPTWVLIPAFVLHEMTVAFKIGIIIYIPFIIIDMSWLDADEHGHDHAAAVMISTPFKLILSCSWTAGGC